MSGTETALLYNDRAVLENHHISASFRWHLIILIIIIFKTFNIPNFHNTALPVCKYEDKIILFPFDGKEDGIFCILTDTSSVFLAYKVLYCICQLFLCKL
jgi:hypothetical protein